MLQEILIILAIVISVSAQWQTIQTYQIVIPFHTFPLPRKSGQNITGNITWDNAAQLDAHLYKKGTGLEPVLIFSFANSNRNFQQFSFQVVEQDTYYIRVVPFPQNIITNNLQHYSISVNDSSTTDSKILSFNGAWIQNHSSIQKNNTAIKVPKENLTSGLIAVNVYGDGSQNISIYAIQFGSSIVKIYNLTQTKFVCPKNSTVEGEWYIVAQRPNPQRNFYREMSIELKIQSNPISCYSQCNYGYKWNQATLKCDEYQQPTNSNNLPVILGAIGGSIAFVALVITLIVCYLKKCNKKPKAIENPYASNSSFRNSQSMINKIQPSQICSVCLTNQCDCFIPCQHFFHKQCLKAWLKKSNDCPLCRHFFVKDDIVKGYII